MNPSDANSSLAALRQLKEMLDAGTLTPQEFEALKQKLIFGPPTTPAEAAEPAVSPSAFIPPVSVSEALTSAPVLPMEDSLPAETPNRMVADAPPLVAPGPTSVVENDYPEEEAIDPADNQRNPLNLVFAIGGALVFLAVVLYLTLGNRTSDEHLTSTTQTAADSTRVAPEVGPQAQQLTLPPATPETVRVAPVAPPVAAPAATKFRADSAAATPVAPAPATTPTAKPAAKPAPATTVAADSAI